jgi:hypothetical protein
MTTSDAVAAIHDARVSTLAAVAMVGVMRALWHVAAADAPGGLDYDRMPSIALEEGAGPLEKLNGRPLKFMKRRGLVLVMMRT